MPRFTNFRVLLTLLVALTASASLSLIAFLIDSFQHHELGWLIVVIESCSILRCAWSISRKSICSRSQSVASEAIGLFVLSPFQLIIILIIPSSPNGIGTSDTRILTALKGLVISSAALRYAVGLIAICTLTIKAYDGDVWLRDIDSSPSPFPLDIIFAFAVPFIARHFSATEPFLPLQIRTACVSSCSPDCGCQGGVRTCSKDSTVISSPQGTVIPNGGLGKRRRPPISARTLIRIPNAAERRATIIVELPLV